MHSQMSVITLTTDFGNRGYMVASIKGAILKEFENVYLVDITHEVEPFNIAEAAFLIRNVYKDFPDGTVHIIGVDSLPNKVTKLLAAKIDGQYFISADNGILSLILAEQRPENMVEITLGRFHEFSNFPTRDIFVPVACHLLRGGKLEVIGNYTETYKELNTIRPVIHGDDNIMGNVIHIDNYGNVITNIQKKLFEEKRRARNFVIQVRHLPFEKIVDRYADAVKDFENEVDYHGEKMVLFNSAGYLEVAVYKGNPNSFGGASSLLGLSVGDVISVEFS